MNTRDLSISIYISKYRYIFNAYANPRVVYNFSLLY